MKHTDWCLTCNPNAHPAWCRVTEAHNREDCLRIDQLVECPVCAPITYAHCAGCRGIGRVTAQDATRIRVTLRR